MTNTKYLKLSSALLLGTLVPGVLFLTKAASGVEDVKRHLQALHAQELATVRAGHGTNLANMTKLKDAMAHPDRALNPATANSVGAALTAAAGDNACVVGGAVAPGAPPGAAMPIATEANKIAAIRALEAAGAHGATNPQHRSAIRTALGLDPSPANFAATQAELNHFLAVAEQRFVNLPLQTLIAGRLDGYINRLVTSQADIAPGGHMANVALELAGVGVGGPGPNAAPAANGMPHGTADQKLNIIQAVEAAATPGPNDAGKSLIRHALNLPTAPNVNSTLVRTYIKVARP
ncbi:MAG: hypothetical protein FJX71_02075 [Alphaproteobacteria bacterium]|nr:hypothetical protein [Alphaproteobacteria bacterium]